MHILSYKILSKLHIKFMLNSYIFQLDSPLLLQFLSQPHQQSLKIFLRKKIGPMSCDK